MTTRIALLVGILLAPVAAAATTPSAPDWPQWRGRNRDGISTETGLLRAWPEGGPRELWRRQVGSGYSGVAVAGDRLFTSWEDGGKQYLFGLDAASGRTLWRREIGAAFHSHYGDGPRSTPLVDGGTVFAIGAGGLLIAVDAGTGEPRWRRDLAQQFAASPPSYGYSSSPLIAGELLVVEVGGKEAAFVAFDRRTGEVAWSAGDDQPAYSSPIHVSIAGVDQVVFWSAHGLHAVATASGKTLWDYPWETLCPATGVPLNTGTPLFVAPDRIYISSGSGAALVRLSRVEDTFRAETVWTSEAMRSDVSTGLVLEGHIYGFDRGTLKSLDVENGEPGWKARGFQRGSLIAVDGSLIVLGENGNLALVDADPQAYVERATAQVLNGRSWTSPSLAEGRLYLRNHEELVCLALKDSPTGPDAPRSDGSGGRR